MPNRMERFTQQARKVLSFAQETAERLQHNYIGTEHLLLGLMSEKDGVAARVLKDLGLDRRRVEELVEQMTRAGQRVPNERLALSPGAKKILELAVDESRRMGHHYIGTEHLLLGLVRQSEGVAIDVLKLLNVSPQEVRRQTRRLLQESSEVTRTESGDPLKTFSSKAELSEGSSAQTDNAARASIAALIPAIIAAAQALMTPSPEDEAKLKSTISLLVLGDWQPVLKRAIDEAKTSRHDLVRTEDLLLALISYSGEYPAYLLRALGLRWDEAREKIKLGPIQKQGSIKELDQEKSGEQHALNVETGFTAYAIKALALGAREAFDQIIPAFIAEYLLLGLVLQEESSAIDLLKESGITPEAVRTAVLNVLKP